MPETKKSGAWTQPPAFGLKLIFTEYIYQIPGNSDVGNIRTWIFRVEGLYVDQWIDWLLRLLYPVTLTFDFGLFQTFRAPFKKTSSCTAACSAPSATSASTQTSFVARLWWVVRIEGKIIPSGVSVTRFGEILPLWGFIYYLSNFGPTLANFECHGVNFYSCKRPNVEK